MKIRIFVNFQTHCFPKPGRVTTILNTYLASAFQNLSTLNHLGDGRRFFFLFNDKCYSCSKISGDFSVVLDRF